jgi:hypothetical protein
MQIPMFVINGLLYANPHAYLDESLPLLSISGYSGGELLVSLPGLSLFAEAHQDPIAEVVANLPKLTLSASGYADEAAALNCLLPSILLSAEGSQSGISELSRDLPILYLEANAIQGDSFNLAVNIPLLELDATAYWLSPGSLDAILPKLVLSATARTVYSALSFNIKNQALTSYPTFDYNQMVSFNGKSVGISRTGIYELSGDKDDNANIPWKIRSGKLDLKKNHLRQVWITGKQDGDVTLAIEDAEGNRYEYQEVSLYENESELRIKVGRGIKTRYFILELSGNNTAAIDQLRVFGSPTERKR